MSTALFPPPKVQFFDSNNPAAPLSGGKVYFYEPGTVTPKDTYSDYAGSTANANPVVLDSRGEAAIRLNGRYDVVVKDSGDSTVYTFSDVFGSLDSLTLTHSTGGAAGTVSAKFDNMDAAWINVADEGVLPANSATANTTALNALRTKMLDDNTRHWVLFFPPGAYKYTHPRFLWGVDRITIHAYGCTFQNTAASTETYDVDSVALVTEQNCFQDYAYGGFVETFVDGYLIDTNTPHTNTVTTSTASEAGNFSAGDKVLVFGFDQQFSGYPLNPRYFEYAEVVSADSGTGVVTLDKDLQNKYRSDWYEYSSATYPFGPGRILNLSRSNSSQKTLLVINGAEFIEDDAWSNTVNGGLYLWNVKRAVLNDVTAPYFTAAEVEYVETNRCVFPYAEPDKIVKTFVSNETVYDTMTQCTGIDRVLVNGGSITRTCDIQARNVVVDGTELSCDLNDAVFRWDAWVVRNAVLRNIKWNPASGSVSLLDQNTRASFTIASVVDSDTVTITTDASARSALRSLDIGSTIFTAPATTGPAKRGTVKEIYAVAGTIYIDADFDVAPTVAETWYCNKVWNLTVDNIEQGGPYSPRPVNEASSNSLSAVECINDKTADGSGIYKTLKKQFITKYKEADTQIDINGYIKSMSIWVQEPYTGADGNPRLFIQNQTPTSKSYATIRVDSAGMRELFASSTFGAVGSDVLSPTDMAWCDVLLIRPFGASQNVLTHTDDTELPIVVFEVEYLTQV